MIASTTPPRSLVILPTIDVEAAHGGKPFEQMILGETTEGTHWGTFEIAQILEDFGATGTFFVDVYEDVMWGADRMKDLCQRLVARGHDVQLHTHPSWRRDPRDTDALNDFKAERCRFPPEKDFMTKLDLDEQTAFIAEGKALLENWVDAPVIAHRSGGYSINADTITALVRNDIFIDSSMNASHANSHLTWSDNLPVRREGVLQLPVSIYRLKAAPFAPGRLQKRMKVDLDSTPFRVLCDLTQRFEAQELRALHLFMHSFTLLDMISYTSRIKPHHARIKRMRDYLGFLRKNGWQARSIADLVAEVEWGRDILKGEDFVPDVVDPALFTRLVALRIRRMFVEKSL